MLIMGTGMFFSFFNFVVLVVCFWDWLGGALEGNSFWSMWEMGEMGTIERMGGWRSGWLGLESVD